MIWRQKTAGQRGHPHKETQVFSRARYYGTKNQGISEVSTDFFYALTENREAPKKRRFLCHARRKAQEYSESLSSIFNEAWREKIPFEAVYPYADVPKGSFLSNAISDAFGNLRIDSRDELLDLSLNGLSGILNRNIRTE